MSTKILIGCPIYKRAWILPSWFEAIENQTVPLEDIGFIFELGPDDDETHEVLAEWHEAHPEVEIFDGIIREDEHHEHHPEHGRVWRKSDYYRMVDFRNSLLDRVTSIGPDRYFSLDSDILLENPRTLEKLYEYTDKMPVVSPLMFMFPKGVDFPSVMTWREAIGRRAYRDRGNYMWGTVFKADIVMAAVMMRPEVYEHVRYRWHPQGEDLGFAWAAGEKGISMYCASDIYCPHIMHQWQFEEYKNTGDNRYDLLMGSPAVT